MNRRQFIYLFLAALIWGFFVGLPFACAEFHIERGEYAMALFCRSVGLGWAMILTYITLEPED